MWPKTVSEAVERLVRDRVLALRDDGSVVLAPGVPASLRPFLLGLTEALAPHDPRLVARPLDPGPRVAAFNRALDGAPRLFGTDVRLRNLMALAVHENCINGANRERVGCFPLRSHVRLMLEDTKATIVRSVHRVVEQQQVHVVPASERAHIVNGKRSANTLPHIKRYVFRVVEQQRTRDNAP